MKDIELYLPIVKKNLISIVTFFLGTMKTLKRVQNISSSRYNYLPKLSAEPN